MGAFDGILGQAGNLDIGALAQKVGLSREQAQEAAQALMRRLAGGGESEQAAVAGASAETGISPDKLMALLPQLKAMLGEGGLQGLASKLDRDGDGNPLNDLGGIASGLFNR